MPWFRLYTEFASDPVMQSLAFEDQRHFVVLLCLKGNGTLDRPMKPSARDRIIYRGLGLDPNSAEEARRRLMEAEIIDAKWQPKAWDKRQFLSDHSAKRTRNYRKNKEVSDGISASLRQPCDGIIYRTDTDTEQIQNRKREDGASRRSPRRKSQLPNDFDLTPERTNVFRDAHPAGDLPVEWAQFLDHHRGNGSVKQDWDACWRTWCRNSKKFSGGKNGTNQSNSRESAAERVYRINATDPDPEIDRYL